MAIVRMKKRRLFVEKAESASYAGDSSSADEANSRMIVRKNDVIDLDNNNGIQKPRNFFGKIYKTQAKINLPKKQILKKRPVFATRAESALSTNVKRSRYDVDPSSGDEANVNGIQEPVIFLGKISKRQARRNPPDKQILKKNDESRFAEKQIESSSSENWLPPLPLLFDSSDQFLDGCEIQPSEFAGGSDQFLYGCEIQSFEFSGDGVMNLGSEFWSRIIADDDGFLLKKFGEFDDGDWMGGTDSRESFCN